MAIVKALCPSCGMIVDVNNDGGAAICNDCATPFVIANAIEAYTHSLQGKALEEGVKNGNALLHFQEWDKAYTVFTDLTEQYPHDARVWIGVARALSWEQECHTVDIQMVQIIRRSIQKAQSINPYVVDDSWDVYLENEEDRLQRAAKQKEMMQRKLQREYDEVATRAHRQLGTLVANKRAMRSTYIILGVLILLLAGGLTGANLLGYLPHIWYLYIAGVVAALGLVLFSMGLASSPKRVSLPSSDVEEIKRTVERIQLSAKRTGVTIDMSEKIKTFVAPNT